MITQKTMKQPLGEILEAAGLISNSQKEVALMDQQYNSNLLIGEILALRGWIDQETADFFAVDFPKIKKQQQRELIGTYLKKAKLLTEKQIETILEEQKHNIIPFVSLAVLKGYLKQKTLKFLEENLFESEKITPASKVTLGKTKFGRNINYKDTLKEYEKHLMEQQKNSHRNSEKPTLPETKQKIIEKSDIKWLG